MKKLTVVCDRCDTLIDTGYYDTSGGEWSWFAEPHEKVICDHCMHKDSRYRELYGNIAWQEID